jgi:hypothetical protein
MPTVTRSRDLIILFVEQGERDMAPARRYSAAASPVCVSQKSWNRYRNLPQSASRTHDEKLNVAAVIIVTVVIMKHTLQALCSATVQLEFSTLK